VCSSQKYLKQIGHLWSRVSVSALPHSWQIVSLVSGFLLLMDGRSIILRWNPYPARVAAIPDPENGGVAQR
jgi:hypothetical protein